MSQMINQQRKRTSRSVERWHRKPARVCWIRKPCKVFYGEERGKRQQKNKDRECMIYGIDLKRKYSKFRKEIKVCSTGVMPTPYTATCSKDVSVYNYEDNRYN